MLLSIIWVKTEFQKRSRSFWATACYFLTSCPYINRWVALRKRYLTVLLNWPNIFKLLLLQLNMKCWVKGKV